MDSDLLDEIEDDQEHPEKNLPNDLSPDTSVYRYMPIDRFFNMVSRKEIVLRKPHLWEDPFENFLARTKVLDNGEEIGFNLTNDFYGQCWTLKKECDGFWRSYCSLSEGVRIETTAAKLINAVWVKEDECRVLRPFVRKVQYLTDDKLKANLKGCMQLGHWLTDTSGCGIARTLLIKRIEFTWEEEVRVLASDNATAKTMDSKSFKIEPTDFIKSIMFAPKMNRARYDAYQEYLINMGFESAAVSRSTLYDPWTLTLREDAIANSETQGEPD